MVTGAGGMSGTGSSWMAGARMGWRRRASALSSSATSSREGVLACLHDAHEVGWYNTLESKTDGDTSGVHDVGSSKSMGSYRSCPCIQSHHSDMHIGLRLASMLRTGVIDATHHCDVCLGDDIPNGSLGDTMGVLVSRGRSLYTIS